MGSHRAARASGEDEVFSPTPHASGVGDSEAPAGGKGAAGRQTLGTCLPQGRGAAAGTPGGCEGGGGQQRIPGSSARLCKCKILPSRSFILSRGKGSPQQLSP